MLAPIILFVYRRLEHTKIVLNALAHADLARQSKLFIFSDGAKNYEDIEEVCEINKIRELIREKKWCGEVEIIERETNWGLADNIVDGVTRIINEFGKVIVLESDILISKGFLVYMNEALTIYENDNRVAHISGYVYPYNRCLRPKSDTFFLRIFSCWGWATWKRAWSLYNPSVDDHLSKLKSEDDIREFNIEGHSDAFLQLLNNKQGITYTWAVKWFASWYFAGCISLFPKVSLVQNIGHDGSGKHSVKTNLFDVKVKDRIAVKKIPLVENKFIRKSIDRFYKRVYHTIPISFRLKTKMRKIVGNRFYEHMKMHLQSFLGIRSDRL
jgi:hypothetical protein